MFTNLLAQHANELQHQTLAITPGHELHAPSVETPGPDGPEPRTATSSAESPIDPRALHTAELIRSEPGNEPTIGWEP